MTHAPPELTIDPPGDAWGAQMRHNTSPRARRFREQLALPTDRPVVMSGHQAQIWHPGILSKYLALDAFVRARGAHPAWLVVDQDTGEPTRFRYASSPPGERRRAGEAELAPGARAEPHAPTALRPPATITRAPPSELREIADALRAHEQAPSLSEQVQLAAQDLLTPIVEPVQRVSAMRLRETALFEQFVGWVRERPGECREAYNDAIARVPGSGVRPLRAGDDASGPEVPLWLLRDGVRTPAYARDLRGVAPADLAPRALAMTGLVRLGACDLFIHGLGGGVYDRVTDRWLASWLASGLNDAAGELAASVVVSATVRLGGDADLGGVEEADAHAWRAHAARHNPALLGDGAGADEKRRLLDAIRTSDPDRARTLYRQMHALLGRVRSEHADELTRLDGLARSARGASAQARRDAAIARDRTLAFPLYPEPELLALRALIRDALTPAG